MSQDLVVQALVALKQKDYASARARITAYANDNPLELQHYLIKGLSELALADSVAARDTFAEAVRDFPHQPQLWFNSGVALENLGAIDEAVYAYERSLDLNPQQAEACGNLSNLYRRQGRLSEAEDMAHRAYEMGAPKAQSLNILGLALARQGKFEAATKVISEARQIEPGNAQYLANLANLAVDQLKFDAAWPLFAAARIAGDNAAVRRDEGMARLLAGHTNEGWPLYEARLEMPTALRVRPNIPRWRDEPLEGKRLLLVAEQGFGDTIQFCRYGRLLRDMGATLIWLVPKPLERLLLDNLPGLVVPEGDSVPEADYWLPMLSLPLALGKLDFAEAPPAPYMHAPTSPKLPYARAARKFGIVWTASPTNERDYEKSLPVEVLKPLFGLRNTQFFAPFINPRMDEIDKYPVVRLDKIITDFADAAALFMQLTGLITCCTAAAHLAGALGVKTWLLLPYCPDWRWGVEGDTTPWYSSVTLIRQPKFGDWESVIAELLTKITPLN